MLIPSMIGQMKTLKTALLGLFFIIILIRRHIFKPDKYFLAKQKPTTSISLLRRIKFI